MQTIPIVEKIKKQEEEKYNISLKIETPTVIKYFKDNIKGKNLKLSETISTIIIGLNSIGVTDCDDKEIIIFKKSQGICKHFKKSLKYRFNESVISFTTFHEIRHILQNERKDLFQDYDFFCIQNLTIMNNKYLINTEYHDSQYFEIDANIYGAIETKKLFKNDNKIANHFDLLLSDYLYEKYTYNFDYFFNQFLKEINFGFEEDYYNEDSLIKTYWNIDGSFKDLDSLIKQKETVKNTKLFTKIVTSNGFLLTINTENLQTFEIDFINDQIKKAIDYFAEDIKNISDLYINKKISKKSYKIAIDYIKKQIEKKQNILNTINNSNKKSKNKTLKRIIRK